MHLRKRWKCRGNCCINNYLLVLTYCRVLHLLINGRRFCDLRPQVQRSGVTALRCSGWRSWPTLCGIWVSLWQSQWSAEIDRYPPGAVNNRYTLILTWAKEAGRLKVWCGSKQEMSIRGKDRGKQKQSNGKR